MFVCKECGFDSKKWLGKCPNCNQWNSFAEFKDKDLKSKNKVVFGKNEIATSSILSAFNEKLEDKIPTNISEFDRVMSGGFYPGSVTIISGEPGIGKSTLLLQITNNLSKFGYSVLYCSGEESGGQVASRAIRLGCQIDKVSFLNSTCVEDIQDAALKLAAKFIVVDSIQTCYSSSVDQGVGSIVQVKSCASILTNFAKQNNVSVVLIGHVTKDGTVAGPKALEHIVDTIISFEESTDLFTRFVRCTKNRFGMVNEIGLFEMTSVGLNSVVNVSSFFLSTDGRNKILFATGDSNRSLILEIESLVTKSYLPVPRRVVVGWDQNRLSIIIALMSKCGMKFFENDIYCSISSGFKTNETGADLAFCVALLKSYNDLFLPDLLAIGEVGLSGVVKNVHKIKDRISEGIRFGIKTFVVPDVDGLDFKDIKLIKIKHVKNLLNELIGISKKI